MKKNTFNSRLKTVAYVGVFSIFCCSAAYAESQHEPWGFKAQNRASIAALMQQVEKGGTSGTTTTTTPSVTSLVCGGDGESSARGNATCVILNNATGNIELTQDALGDQSANSTVSQADEVLETLQ